MRRTVADCDICGMENLKDYVSMYKTVLKNVDESGTEYYNYLPVDLCTICASNYIEGIHCSTSADAKISVFDSLIKTKGKKIL